MKKAFLLFTLMAILVAACDQPTPTQATTVPPSPAPPTDVPAPPTDVPATASPVPAVAGPDTIDLDDPDLYGAPEGINYFTRLEFDMDVTQADGTMTNGHITGEGGYTVGPPEASNLVFRAKGTAMGFGEIFGITRIGNDLYFQLSLTNCVSFSGGQTLENPFDILLDTGGFLTGLATRVLPDEVINGIPAYRYNIDDSNVASFAVASITAGSMYIAQEGGYVLRVLISGVGVSELLSGNPGIEGEIDYGLNFTPTDELIEIVPPEGC